MKKIMTLVTAAICAAVCILSSFISASAGEFDNAKDYYDTYGFTGAYNAADNRIYFGTNDTLTDVYTRYVTIGKRIYLWNSPDIYIDLARYGGYYMQEADTIMDGSTEYLMYSVDWNAVCGLFLNKYGYIDEIMGDDVIINLGIDDIMTVMYNGVHQGTLSDIGDGTVNEDGEVAYSRLAMKKMWYQKTGQINEFDQYYRQQLTFKPHKGMINPGTYNADYVLDWKNYAFDINPWDYYDGDEDVEYWSEPSFHAEEEGIHQHTFTGYRIVETGGDPIPGTWGPAGFDELGNQKYDYDYTPITREPEACAWITVTYKIDYTPPVICNVNDRYGWINYSLFIAPGSYDKAPDDNPSIEFSTLKSIKVVGSRDGIENILNEDVETHTNVASMYLTYRNEGSHTLTLQAEDWAGNITQFNIAIFQDFTPPDFRLLTTECDYQIMDHQVQGMWWVGIDSDKFEFEFSDQSWLSGLDYATLYDHRGGLQDKDTGDPAVVGFEVYLEHMVNQDMNDYMYYDYFLLHAYDNAGNETIVHCWPYNLMNMHWYRYTPKENYNWNNR